MRPDEIDLSKLSAEDLQELNRRVIEQYHRLMQRRCRETLLDFEPGDRVYFTHDDGRKITGTVIRVNRKSVTLHSDDHHHWRVSPFLVSRVHERARSDSKNPDVIPIRRH